MSPRRVREHLTALVLGAGVLVGCPRASESDATREAPPPANTAASTSIATNWTVETTARGRLSIQLDHHERLAMRHAAYHDGWKFEHPTIVPRPAPKGEQAFTAKFSDVPVTLEGHLRRTSDRTVRIDYTLEVREAFEGLDGLGLEFEIGEPHPPDVALRGANLAVDLGQQGAIELSFEGEGLAPRTRAHSDRPEILRSFWIAGAPREGIHRASIEITLPQPFVLEPSLAERYGSDDRSAWIADAMVWDAWPVDVGFLNQAHGVAGSHGRVQVRGDTLVFEDGTPARFWGTNLAATALFEADDEAIALQARRLSALGYNLVRLHHHDAGWIRRNVFDTSGGTTQALDPTSLQRLDAWIDILASEGIYTWVDLHVTRSFLEGDEIPGYEELGPRDTHQGKGASYVNPRVEELMQRFADQYLGRVNRRRKTKWLDDPAIVGVLVTNENDLTDHFGTAFLPERGRPKHTKMFKARAKAIIEELGLPPKKAREVWKPGHGKVLLAELQHRFDARALAQLRERGVRVPIATTNHWGSPKAYSLVPLSFGDIIDVHTYGQSESLSNDPRREPSWVHAIGAAQVVGKPLSVSEWSVPAPATDRFTAPLWASALGSLQRWDMMMAFAYTQHPIEPPSRDDKWSTWNDPALQALAPTAALMFRRGDVRPAEQTFVLQPSLKELWGTKLSPRTSAAIRTLTERSRLLIALPDHPALDWDRASEIPGGATVVRDPSRSFAEPDAHAIRADTGELERDWVAGVLRIDTPRAQAISGWIGGSTVRLGDVQFEITTPKATVSVISLDGRSIATSEHLLVTAVGRAVPQPGAPGHFLSEPIVGAVEVPASGPRVLLPAHSARGATPPALGPPESPSQGRLRFELRADHGTHWFHIIKPAQARDDAEPSRQYAG